MPSHWSGILWSDKRSRLEREPRANKWHDKKPGRITRLLSLAVLVWIGSLAAVDVWPLVETYGPTLDGAGGASNREGATPTIAASPVPVLAPSPSPSQNFESQPTRPTRTPDPLALKPPAEVLPKPVTVLTGVIRSRMKGQALAPLRVETASGSNYLVKLSKTANRSEHIFIYIEGGKSFKTNMPLGKFEFLYATGQTWYGEKHRFGPETAYFRAETILRFHQEGNKLNGYTVQLVKQVGGNLPTTPTNAREFDR
jgi:hypothetical protein